MSAENTEQRKLAAIMFTDMVGYSTLSQRNEKLAQELLEEHRAILRSLFIRFNGAEIKTIGDAFLVEFHSALEAAQCGIEIQRALAKRNHDVPNDRRVEIKIGIHIGDVVHRGGDVYGDGVNIASRIEPLAGAGGICVSMDVERQIRNALEARFEKLAPTELKNISVVMDLFRIVLPWEVQNPKPTGFAISLVPSDRTSPDLKSIAVLAFANLSGDKENEYFSDGISEELLNVLAKIQGLKVTARTSAFHFKGKDTPIPEIARQLGVAYVVEGSVRKSGGRVRITAQLIKAADGFHVWSDNFTRDLQDIFAVQDEIAGLIAKNLQLKFAETPAVSRTVNPEAHRLVLKGRYFWNRRTMEGFAQAEQSFRRAIEVDPDFAEAYAGLADVLVTKASFLALAGEPTDAIMSRARVPAERARALDPNLADAYPAMGTIKMCEGRLHEAEQECRRACELNPNYAQAHHWLGLILENQGRIDLALEETDRALSIDPLWVPAAIGRLRLLSALKRYDEALVEFPQVQALRPDLDIIASAGARLQLAVGRPAEALETAREVCARPASNLRWFVDADLIYVFYATGNFAEAGEHASRLLAKLPPENYIRGIILGALGRWEEALPLLEKMPRWILSFVYWHPIFDSFYDDPRFRQLLVKLGCADEYDVARVTLKRLSLEQGEK